MFAANLVNLVRHLIVDDTVVVNSDDEIVTSMLVTAGGVVVHPGVRRTLEGTSGPVVENGTGL
jgi:hypothetical protein